MPGNYTLVRSRRRSLSILVTRDARVVVRAPQRTSQEQIDLFVQKHSAWIQKHLQTAKQNLQQRMSFTFGDGDRFPLFGSSHTIASGDVQRAQLSEGRVLLLPPDKEHRPQHLQAYLREAAAELLPQRVEFYARQMGVSPSAIRITGARTRWGSCSGKNNLCFSFRLICLPAELIDAVVVHELAHIRIKNHSDAFYELVYQTLPAYDELHAQLRHWSSVLPL